MMGFAGQLSLGHALYVGLGGYVAAILFTQFGIGPWLGLLAAMPVAAACGGGHRLPCLPLRRCWRLFRHPHHRLCRIRPHRLRSSGTSSTARADCSCRSSNTPTTICGGCAAIRRCSTTSSSPRRSRHLRSAVFCIRSRVGYFWLAIREDEQAARAAGIDTFRYKMYAVMMSAAMTSFAGVFYAFFYNNLFPEQVFGISRSIEIILGPDHRRRRHAVRSDPRRLCAYRACRSAQLAVLSASGIDLPGAKQVFYGICLLIVIVAMPDGVWPPLARRLGVGKAGK